MSKKTYSLSLADVQSIAKALDVAEDVLEGTQSFDSEWRRLRKMFGCRCITVTAEFEFKDTGLVYATSQVSGDPEDAELCRMIGKALEQVMVDYNTNRPDLNAR